MIFVLGAQHTTACPVGLSVPVNTRSRYLRVLFVQAASVVLIKLNSWQRHGLKPWIEAAKKRLHRNVLPIALANKLARIAWGVLAHGRSFEARPAVAPAA